MANIKKSFNFRNGVQVDEDNLLVTPTGLVAIGKTIPTEALDVIGNVVVSGLTSSVFTQTGVLTVTTLEPTTIIGAGVSIVSGIITSNSGSGIVTYYGDARFLQGMPTSQWQDTNAGFGVSSIYNTGGTVGIATTNPQFTLQIGQNPDDEVPGVGIASAGNIKAHGNITSKSINVGNNIQLGNAGIITAASFVGNLSGDVTGNVTGTVTGNINSGLGTITDINATNINVSGLSTFAGITSVTGPVFHSKQQIISGMSTFSGGVSINNLHIGHIGNGVVGGGATINTSGGDLNLSCGGPSGADPGDEIVCHEDVRILGGLNATGTVQAQQLGASATLSAASVVATNGTFGSSGFLSAQAGISVKDLRIATGTNRTLITTPVGISTVTISGANLELKDKVFINGINPVLRSEGSITLSQDSNNNLAKIGVGTISPANDIQVRRFTGNAEIQVTADAGIAGITVGRETGTNNTNNAEVRYGGGTGFPYSHDQSFDLVNYGIDNFNFHLSANNAGAVKGDFHWHKGKNNTRLMTLTNTGKLGIGITVPTEALDVGGNLKVRGTTIFDDIVTIQGGINVAAGSLTASNITANVIGNITGNVNATSGISTFFNVRVTDANNNFEGIGIKTDNTSNLPLDIFGDGESTDKRLFVSADARIGIKTDEINPGIDINAVDSRVSIQSMGVGTTNPQSAVDMRFAGQELTGIFANRMYMYPPQVTDTQRGNLAGVAAGAVIYNTTTNKLQVYNGSAWQDCN